MTDERFCSLLDEHGGDIDRWPAQLRDEARGLLAHSPQARAGLKAMQDVESLLVHTPATAFEAAGLAARASRQAQGRRPLMNPHLRRASFAALGAMALAAGILVGMMPSSDTTIVGSVQMALNGSGSDVQ